MTHRTRVYLSLDAQHFVVVVCFVLFELVCYLFHTAVHTKNNNDNDDGGDGGGGGDGGDDVTVTRTAIEIFARLS